MPRARPRLARVRDAFQGLPREVTVLAAVAAAVGAGFGVVGVALPDFARSFGVSNTAASAVVSAFAFMRFISALGCGRLVDSVGERVVLVSGIAIVAVSTGLAGLSQSYGQLFVLRGLGGIGSAMFTVSAIALLYRTVGASDRGRAGGLFQSGFLIGGLLGPMLGGYITDYSLRLPFYVYAVSLVAAGSIGGVFLSSSRLRPAQADGVDDAAAAADGADAPSVGGAVEPEAALLVEDAVVVEEGAEPPPAVESRTTSFAEAWANPAYRAAVAVNFAVGWAFFGIRASLIPLFVSEVMGLPHRWTGIGFTCSVVAQALFLVVSGPFVDRRGRKPAMVLGTALSTGALGVLALSSARPVFLASMTVMGIGGAFLGTAPGAVVGDVLRGSGGRVVAVFQMASDGGVIIGPLAAGALSDHVSFGAAFAASAVLLALACALSLRMPETLRRGAPAESPG